MNLPGAAKAPVEGKKIVDYLLASSHPTADRKRGFTLGLASAWKSGKRWRALRQHGRVHKVTGSIESKYGRRYIVEGSLETPDGRNPRVRTVWVLTETVKILAACNSIPRSRSNR